LKLDLKKNQDKENVRREFLRVNTENEIIDLNVGGTSLSVSLDDLTKFEGSKLADMFSGDIYAINKDQNGKIFISRDSKFFGYVLNYIRSNGVFSPIDVEKSEKKLF